MSSPLQPLIDISRLLAALPSLFANRARLSQDQQITLVVFTAIEALLLAGLLFALARLVGTYLRVRRSHRAPAVVVEHQTRTVRRDGHTRTLV